MKHPEEVLVSKIRRTELRRPVLARLAHPKQRPAHEQSRVHDSVLHAGRQHAQVEADEAHVVRERHPAQAPVIRIPLGAFDDRANIRGQVRM